MLQEHSFFSQPSIFFGPPQNESEEVDDSDARRIVLQTDLPFHRQSHIGLSIHWSGLKDIL